MRCKNCGMEIPESFNYCPYCGARTPRGVRRNAALIVLAVIVVAEAVAIIGLYALYIDVCLKYENLLYYGFKTVKLTYAIEYGQIKIRKTLEIKAKDYIAYFSADHGVHRLEDYAKFVTENDPYIKQIASWLSQITDPEEKADAALSLCQLSIQYEANEAVYYPLETIVRESGACDEKSILYASIMKALGYDVVLIAYIEALHMNVGVHLPYPPRHSRDAYGILVEGKYYYMAETTNPGFLVGDLPRDLVGQEYYVIKV